VIIMNGRRARQLLLVFAVLGASGAAMAGRGGWGGGSYYHGGGGGGWGGGGNYHGGGSWGGGGNYHGGGYYHGGYCCGGSIGLYFGPGFVYGYPYPYPYYYPGYYPGYYSYGPMSVGESSSPTQYIEQGQSDMAGGAAPQVGYWYHCGKPEGYYPYIKACPGGWQKVPAQPPGS
jgi:hypothetical protein